MGTGKRKYQYLQLADELELKIAGGSFRAGEKLPSLRNTHKSTGLSISTVSQAYAELENRGAVEPREKSGFFVRPRLHDILPPITFKRYKPAPTKVSLNILADSIYKALHEPGMVPFGAAVPAMELLPRRQLASSFRSVVGQYSKDFNYGPPSGVGELKRQIVKRAIAYDQRIAEEEIIISNGCMDAIHLCLLAVAKPGDTILVESPTFNCYLQLIEDLNMFALEMPTDPGQGIDLKALVGAIDTHNVTACIVCPNFHNPLGYVMPDAAKKQLVTILGDRNIPIIEDDIYGDLYFGDVRPFPLKKLDRRGMVLYCSSFSKTLAPDLRVGWLLPGRYISQVQRIKFNTVIASSRLNQLVIADYLQNSSFDRHLRRLRTALKNQATNMAIAIKNYFPEGTRISTPQGGYVIWVELPENIDSLKLFHKAKENKIFFFPGTICSSTRKYKNCMRMSFGHPWSEVLEEGVKKLGRLISSLA